MFISRRGNDEVCKAMDKNFLPSSGMAPKSSYEEKTDANEFGLSDKQKRSSDESCDVVTVQKSDSSEGPCKKRNLDGRFVANEVDDVLAVDSPSSDNGDVVDPWCSLERASPVVNCSGSMAASPPDVNGYEQCCSNKKPSKEEGAAVKSAAAMENSDQEEQNEAQSDAADET